MGRKLLFQVHFQELTTINTPYKQKECLGVLDAQP